MGIWSEYLDMFITTTTTTTEIQIHNVSASSRPLLVRYSRILHAWGKFVETKTFSTLLFILLSFVKHLWYVPYGDVTILDVVLSVLYAVAAAVVCHV